MKPPYYEPQEHTPYRRHLNQDINFPIPTRRSSESQSDNYSDNYSDMASTSVIQSHQSTEHSSKSNTQVPLRRRIQVACLRCRKRKIRCSGAPDGQGSCTNCKSSGTTTCAFVRVNSALLQPGSAWHYNNNVLKSTDSSIYDTRRGSWEGQTYSRAHSISMHSAPHLPSDSSPVSPDLGYGPTSQSPIYQRSSYSTGYPLTYDDNSMAYAMQAPSYMLPSADTSAISNVCAVPTNMRGWGSNSQSLKPSNTALYCDPDTPASLGYSFTSATSSQAPVSAEGASMFGVSAALSSGLTGDRTLPNPVTSRSTSNLFPATVAETLSYTGNGNNAQSYRISQLLSAEYHLGGNYRETSRIAPKATTAAVDISPDGKGTSLDQSRDIGFGYMQSVDMPDGFQSSDSERSKKDDSIYSSDTCTSTAYEFSPSTNGKAPTLTSGHIYTQLIHPQTSHSPTMIMRANADNASVTGTAGNSLISNSTRHTF